MNINYIEYPSTSGSFVTTSGSHNDNIGLFATLMAVLGVIIILARNTQRPLTVNNYVTNTYLYILLAILLCALVIIIMDKYHIFNNINAMTGLAIFIIVMVVMSAMLMLNKSFTVLRHVLWVIFIVGIAVLLFPIYDVAKQTSILWKCLITVIVLVLGLTYLASRLPRNYFQSWGSYLSIGLLALIIFEILDLIFSDSSTVYAHQKIYGIIGVVLFSGFILYNTNQVYEHAEDVVFYCEGINNQLKCTDYPGESLNIFLDVINLFASSVMSQR